MGVDRDGRGAVRFEIATMWDGNDPWGTGLSALAGLVSALRVLAGRVPEGFALVVPTEEEEARARDEYPSGRFLDMERDGECSVADLEYWARVMDRFVELVPEDRRY